MWNIYASKEKPFWAVQNGNKPNIDVFLKFDNSLTKIKGNINFVDFFRAEFVSDIDTYKWFKVVKGEDVKYYYVDSTKIVQNNSYVYNLSLDIYSTYTLKFIEDNKNVPLTFNRTHEYNKNVAVLGDVDLDSMPKSYKSINYSRFNYPMSGETDKYYYNNYFGLKNPENNAYKYFVFNDGPNGTYTMVPCINNAKPVSYIEQGYTQGTKIYEARFWNGDYKLYNANREYRTQIDPSINEKIIEAYKTGKIVKYRYRTLIDRISWAQFSDWKEVEVLHNTMPRDIYMSGSGEEQIKGLRLLNYYITINGVQVASGCVDGITDPNWHASWTRLKTLTEFHVIIYDKIPVSKPEKTYHNSYQTIYDTLINDPNYTNKFVGIFAGPNLLAFDTKNFGNIKIQDKEFLSISLPANGIDIPEYSIYRYIYRKKNCLNNTDLGYEYSLKFLNINYFNNNINAIFRANSQSLVNLSGKLIFSNGFYLLNKNSDLISLNSSIIYFGGELPNSRDSYKQYVNGQRNSLDTSFNIKRQEAMVSNLKAAAGIGVDVIKGGIDAAASLTTGNVGGAIKSMSNAAFSPLKAMGQIFDTERQIQNHRKTMASQFADANLTMGNQINVSSAADAAMMLYCESNGEQFEVVEVLDLSQYSNIIINNYILLNGYYHPHTNTFKQYTSNDRKFNYIEVDKLVLENNININTKLNNDVLELVKLQLINGIRIWNVENTNLPDGLIEDIPPENDEYEDLPLIPPSNEIPHPLEDPEAMPAPPVDEVITIETDDTSITVDSMGLLLEQSNKRYYNDKKYKFILNNIQKITIGDEIGDSFHLVCKVDPEIVFNNVSGTKLKNIEPLYSIDKIDLYYEKTCGTFKQGNSFTIEKISTPRNAIYAPELTSIRQVEWIMPKIDTEYIAHTIETNFDFIESYEPKYDGHGQMIPVLFVNNGKYVSKYWLDSYHFGGMVETDQRSNGNGTWTHFSFGYCICNEFFDLSDLRPAIAISARGFKITNRNNVNKSTRYWILCDDIYIDGKEYNFSNVSGEYIPDTTYLSDTTIFKSIEKNDILFKDKVGWVNVAPFEAISDWSITSKTGNYKFLKPIKYRNFKPTLINVDAELIEV